MKSVGSSRVLIARRHWVARVRPVLHDAPDKLGRQAMKRRPAALRAAAPFTSLRLRREQQGELVDVSAAVRLPPARVGNPLQVSAIPPIRMSPKARRVIRNSSAGAQEEGICAETDKCAPRAATHKLSLDMSDPLSLRSDSRARERHAVKVEREDQMGPNTER